jgi:adenine-specific DNA methylase
MKDKNEMTNKMKVSEVKTKVIIGYLGGKTRLFNFLYETMISGNEDKKVFVDLFSGTGAVSKMVKETTDMDIITNDLATYSEVLSSELKVDLVDMSKVEDLLVKLDSLEQEEEGVFFNEFSMGGIPTTINDQEVFKVKKKIKEDGKVIEETNENYQEFPNSRMFFKGSVGKKIDTVKKELVRMTENKEITKLEKEIILLFLMSYVSSNSNTSAVYGAYLKHDKFKKRGESPFYNQDLIKYLKKKSLYSNKAKVYNYTGMAEDTLDILESDGILSSNDKEGTNYNKDESIIYWDPPYSSRSYEGNYHILEYAIDLYFDPIKTIKMNSKSAMKKAEEKSDSPFASKVKTPAIFKKLIEKSMKFSNVMYISYSNEGLMKESDIIEIIKELNNGVLKSEEFFLETYRQEYKRFTSGENNGSNDGKKNKVFEIVWKIQRNNKIK